MDEAFAQAIAPARHSVLGLPLEPFTLGHLFLLTELQSPLVNPSRGGASFEDLLLAAFVCSQSHSESRRALRSRWLKPFGWLWGLKARRLNWRSEVAKFSDYLSNAFRTPACVVGSDSTGQLSAPESVRLLAVLMTDFHQTREQAMDMPVCLARALIVANAERLGRVTLVTEEERENIRQLIAESQKEEPDGSS